ncbi:hypothetical protein [Kitasatospora phosalacinea]|uniref:Uncharacterized protein n=1 Tax=Kitasatospora phosalacinea TaxID=2065 RepID=A0A9W6PBN5_9ACTN|nr:hypothetical protein [Kitasatospora phosalacinea]GLW52165.1 hypothetical protein Kpho01_01760 [Kitasatospora phosalacinea]
MTVRFEAAWCNTDLGPYRECAYTYERYPYDSVPPLDAALFTGSFDWLGGPSGEPSGQAAELAELERALDEFGLVLPADFLAYHRDARLAWSLDEVSPTGCWQSFSPPLPSPVEPGAHLVRFFRDQQDCVLWYLYLRPGEEAFVVHSWLDYECQFELVAEGEEPDEELADPGAIRWCAASFEEFAYRYWAEGRIRLDLANGDGPTDPRLLGYLAHYAQQRPGASGPGVSARPPR